MTDAAAFAETAAFAEIHRRAEDHETVSRLGNATQHCRRAPEVIGQ